MRKKIPSLLLFLTLCSFALIATAQKNSNRPNIIFFMVDDMGWQDCSVPFYKDTTALNKKYHTPNMERLAARGVRFTQAYANCVCTPSRVSLHTGMNAARHRVTNWTAFNENNPTDAPYAGITMPAWNYNGLSMTPGVPHTVTANTLPQILSANGYYTIHAGKAHFAATPTPGSDPRNLGFKINIAGSAIGGPKSYLGTDNFGNQVKGGYTPGAIPGLEKYHGQDIFLTEAITREALLALDTARQTQQPFFLYLSHYAVHSAYKADKRFYDRYVREGLGVEEAQYAALIEGMDKSLGDVLDYLDKYQLTKNTIVIFMSDNGGLSLVPPRGGSPFTHNLPLRAGKGSAYEGGTREPMMIAWPGVTKGGTLSDQYMIIEDFFPTILEMAGVRQATTQQTVDGKSLVPFLKRPGLRDTSRILIWHYPNNWAEGFERAKSYNIRAEMQGMGPYSAIRKGDWKLIYFYGTGSTELYNLKKDIGETKNLATQYPAITEQLIQLLRKQLTAENAQYPIRQASGETIQLPNTAER
jgi:arylsulfatase A-like enzyme